MEDGAEANGGAKEKTLIASTNRGEGIRRGTLVFPSEGRIVIILPSGGHGSLDSGKGHRQGEGWSCNW